MSPPRRGNVALGGGAALEAGEADRIERAGLPELEQKRAVRVDDDGIDELLRVASALAAGE